MANDETKNDEAPQAFAITAPQLQFLIGFAQSVPLPRAQTDELAKVLQQVTEQPIAGDAPPGLKLAKG